MTTSLPADRDSGSAQLRRRRALTGILENTIVSLELTPAQRESIEEAYQDCSKHLSRALGLAQEAGEVFPQGSIRLGTVIRPWRDITDVFDLDAVFRIFFPSHSRNAKTFRDEVGRHLRERYNGSVKPLAKGWRLDFSRERDYYLDLIPAMNSPLGGEIIAITDDQVWRDSNPRGYAKWFEDIAAVLPLYEVATERFNETRALANSMSVEPLPEDTDFKSPLQRIVQIAKRQRDYYFNRATKEPDLAPASIVVTTLLAKAYADLMKNQRFFSGFDLLFACISEMPKYIQATERYGQVLYVLPNPSLPTENLVEKWKDARFVQAFRRWHADFISFLVKLTADNAPQRVLLRESFGAAAVDSAYTKQAVSISNARERKVLTVSSAGLGLGSLSVVPGHAPHGI